MSPIGRIFIVLNLILSAAFLGWAANALATVDDYKAQLEKANADHGAAIAAKDKEVETLTIGNNDLSEQQRKFREERDQAKTEVERQKTQLDELKRASDGMQANLNKISATLSDFNQTIAQLTQQKDAASERAHEAERGRDDAVQKEQDAVLAQRDAQEKTKAAEIMIADLQKKGTDLADEVTRLNTQIAVIVDQTGINLSQVVAQPKIEAAVLSVNNDLKLVVFNRGKADGVRAGFTFSVYRGTQYKGEVRIQDVQENLSSGLILNMKSPMATGDSASTGL